jgi:Kef-type K+ transport system membrane component KefB
MADGEIGSITLLLLVVLAAAHLLGYLFVRLRQPRVIGEILAGLLLGPSILGKLTPSLSRLVFSGVSSGSAKHDVVLGFIYSLGLLLLMFVSGTETRHLFGRRDRRQIAWLASLGTGLPFLLTLAAAPLIPVRSFIGPANSRNALLLVLGIAVAVTSIPVISRIFHDLRILHTRFAGLVLGVAVIEDTVLWAVLAIAIALASTAARSQQKITAHIVTTLIYFVAGLTIGPKVIRRLNSAKWNLLAKASPAGYIVGILFAYTAIAAACGVSLVFAAFLAGFGLRTDEQRFVEALNSISSFSFAVFIPIYFAVVGYRLDVSKSFPVSMLALFLVLACGVKLICVTIGAKFAGFPNFDAINLAIATNARGGPGIVLASVAFDAGIINPAFFTSLVLLAVLTSQAAGAWLEFVLRRGWPLLSGEQVETALPAENLVYSKKTRPA